MEAINWVTVSAVIVDLVIISILVSCIYWGQRKGLTDLIFKLVIFIVSLIIAFMFYKPVANFVIEKTQIDEWLNIRIEETLIGHDMVDGEIIQRDETNMPESVVKLLNSIIRDGIKEAKDNLAGYVATKLSYFMILVLTLIALLIIVRVCLGFVKSIATLIAKLPIINLLDQFGGVVFGFLKGVVIIYVILAIISIISPLISELRILNSINNSYIGSKMYNNNLLLNLIIK